MKTDTTITTVPAGKSARPGKVYLVGAGPGDPGLITVRGVELLKIAEVVIYDYLANAKLLQHVHRGAELIYAGKKGGVKHTLTQDEINQMLVARALAGKTVVRLKGGDPFIFGRGGEEIEELVKVGIPFEIVPGVTSATAAATYAGIPITHRQFTSSVAFITGHEDPTKPDSNVAWDKLATGAGTIVIYMGIKNIASITENLTRHGRDPQTPVAVVRWASTPRQKTVVGTLETIAGIVSAADIKPPALIVIGEVVKMRDKIEWFEKRPLFGKRVLVTRTREQASDLVNQLQEAGATCLEYATINIVPPESFDILDQEINRIKQYQWLLFTSINTVSFFFARLFDLGLDVRALQGPRIGVVGKATAEALAAYGIKADHIPEKFTGDGLADSLVRLGVEGDRILLPRAAEARETLPDTLRAAGAAVTVVPVYRNVVPSDRKEGLRQVLQDKKVDVVTFTSSSTVTNFVKMLEVKGVQELQTMLTGVKVAAIGPITADTARQHGLEVHIQPQTFTIPAMVNAINVYFQPSTEHGAQ